MTTNEFINLFFEEIRNEYTENQVLEKKSI